MGKVKDLVLRFGPLLASFGLGLVAVLPSAAASAVQSVVSVLSLVGVSADPSVVASVSAVATGVVALVGVVRKVFNLTAKPAAK
jgi:uncharacterized membrane protein